jgi:hypothetical protein
MGRPDLSAFKELLKYRLNSDISNRVTPIWRIKSYFQEELHLNKQRSILYLIYDNFTKNLRAFFWRLITEEQCTECIFSECKKFPLSIYY